MTKPHWKPSDIEVFFTEPVKGVVATAGVG